MKTEPIVTTRPIILRAWEVRGLLNETVTQFWRPMESGHYAQSYHPYDGDLDDDGWPMACAVVSGCLTRIECPWGGVGDRVWGREAWSLIDDHESAVCVGYVAGPGNDYAREWLTIGVERVEAARKFYGRSVIPAAHMPRWASRITLEVLDAQPVQIREAMRGKGMYRIADFGSRWDADNPRHPYASNPMVWRLIVRRVES